MAPTRRSPADSPASPTAPPPPSAVASSGEHPSTIVGQAAACSSRNELRRARFTAAGSQPGGFESPREGIGLAAINRAPETHVLAVGTHGRSARLSYGAESASMIVTCWIRPPDFVYRKWRHTRSPSNRSHV